jgi:hypothetical protein
MNIVSYQKINEDMQLGKHILQFTSDVLYLLGEELRSVIFACIAYQPVKVCIITNQLVRIYKWWKKFYCVPSTVRPITSSVLGDKTCGQVGDTATLCAQFLPSLITLDVLTK